MREDSGADIRDIDGFQSLDGSIEITEVSHHLKSPAFAYWSEKLLPGEKLPRGKHFREAQGLKDFMCRVYAWNGKDPWRYKN